MNPEKVTASQHPDERPPTSGLSPRLRTHPFAVIDGLADEVEGVLTPDDLPPAAA